jgi:hypothetical protein
MNKTLGKFEAGWRTLQGIYKKLTILTPLGGLHTALRDHLGNHFQSDLAGAWSVAGNAIAAKLSILLGKAGDNPKKLEELMSHLGIAHGLNLAEELKLMKNSNMFDEAFTHAMFGDEKFSGLEKALGMKAISKLRQVSENFSRIQHYITRRLQGYSPEGAIMDVQKKLYDYINLPPAIRTAQNFMPWAAWSMNNIPAMFIGALRRPAKAAGFFRAKQNIEANQQNKPDERALDQYVKGDPHIRLWENPDGKYTYTRLKGFLPIADLEDITSTEKFADFLVSSLTPYLKAPMENFFNRSSFFKTAGGDNAPISEYEGQTGKFLGMDINRKTINLLKNIRPLSEVNKIIQSATPPQAGQPSTGIEPSQYVAGQFGFNLVPINFSRATQQAKKAFQRRLSELNISKKYAEKTQKPTQNIDDLIQQLKSRSYAP